MSFFLKVKFQVDSSRARGFEKLLLATTCWRHLILEIYSISVIYDTVTGMAARKNVRSIFGRMIDLNDNESKAV